MFTGIIEELGTIIDKQIINNNIRWTINLHSLHSVSPALALGESVAINGACHTIESFKSSHINNTDIYATFYSLEQTLSCTNLAELSIDDKVNLELAVTPNTRLGGHFVTGHIDDTARLIKINNLPESEDIILTIALPIQHQSNIIAKGSIALNGISLTIAQIYPDIFNHGNQQYILFDVCVIPHTWQNTTLNDLDTDNNYLINYELDVLGKYALKIH